MLLVQSMPLLSSFTPTGFSKTIFKERYALTPEETWQEACRRVAKQMALAEVPDKQKTYEDKFYDVLVQNLFVPGGRIWYGSGKNNPNMINCFLLGCGPDLDSKEGWGRLAYEMIVTSMHGGGCGMDFSHIRPDGAPISVNKGTCPGPVEAMKMIDGCAEPVRAGGGRRSALLFSLDIDHPDIESFLDCKLAKGQLSHANVSVRSSKTSEFIKAVKNNEMWELSWKGKFKKSVSAHKIWDTIVTNAYNSAEPGFLNWELVNNENTINYLGELESTNPCVSGDTQVLTKQGYYSIAQLVGNEVDIWNGIQWSTVKPFSTGKNPTQVITFSDGSFLRCTPDHKFIIQDSKTYKRKETRVWAQDLKIGDRLVKFDMPILATGGIIPPVDAYSQGFYSGDGTNNYTYSYLYSTKYCCESRLVGSKTSGGLRDIRKKWNHGPMLPKEYVPINSIFNYRMNWLAGILDSDGTVTRDKNGNGFQISSINKRFLQDTKLLLTTLGVQAKIVGGHEEGHRLLPDHKGGKKSYFCQKGYRLLIGNKDAWHLIQIGLKLSRLKHNGQNSQRASRQFVRVISIENDLPCETFCFTDSHNHTGTFNGIVTGQCGEIPMQSYENCCLGHLVLPRYVTEKGEVDYESLGGVIRNAVRFLDNVLSVNHFPLPEMKDKSANFRRIGLGVTGLADMLVLLNLSYGSEEANRFLNKLFRFISKVAYESSVLLAIEKGPFSLCNPRKHVESGFVRRMTPKIRSLILEHGIRNCAILTNAPTGTVSILSGNCSSGIEPIFAPAYERRYWRDKERQVELVLHPLFEQFMTDGRDVSHIIASHDLSVRDHLEVQKVIQQHIDNSISKTINIREDCSLEEMASAWLEYLPYLKGTTFYRENTRGYVDEQGNVHEPPLKALSLKEAKQRFKQKEKTVESGMVDCSSGTCDV